jgi:hypothetical protein
MRCDSAGGLEMLPCAAREPLGDTIMAGAGAQRVPRVPIRQTLSAENIRLSSRVEFILSVAANSTPHRAASGL